MNNYDFETWWEHYDRYIKSCIRPCDFCQSEKKTSPYSICFECGNHGPKYVEMALSMGWITGPPDYPIPYSTI